MCPMGGTFCLQFMPRNQLRYRLCSPFGTWCRWKPFSWRRWRKSNAESSMVGKLSTEELWRNTTNACANRAGTGPSFRKSGIRFGVGGDPRCWPCGHPEKSGEVTQGTVYREKKPVWCSCYNTSKSGRVSGALGEEH